MQYIEKESVVVFFWFFAASHWRWIKTHSRYKVSYEKNFPIIHNTVVKKAFINIFWKSSIIPTYNSTKWNSSCIKYRAVYCTWIIKSWNIYAKIGLLILGNAFCLSRNGHEGKTWIPIRLNQAMTRIWRESKNVGWFLTRKACDSANMTRSQHCFVPAYRKWKIYI